MNFTELTSSNKSIVDYVAKFVNDPRFMLVKDSFVAHSPAGENNEHSVAVAHGKWLGTRYVFNQMESVARPTEKPKREGSSGKDPDLES